MKKQILVALTLGFLFSIQFVNAQSESIRSQRKNAITAEGGFKSLSGVGLNYTRYVNPNVALDFGAGFGTQIFRWGIRGRYMLSKNNFSPYVGLGLILLPLQLNDLEIEEGNGVVIVDINRTVNSQMTVGFEFLSSSGIVLGLNIGYQIPITQPYEIESNYSTETELALNLLYGRGLVFGANLGYAF